MKTEKLAALATKKQDEDMKDESAASQQEESKEEESNLVKEVINGEVVTTIKPAAEQPTSTYKPKEQ